MPATSLPLRTLPTLQMSDHAYYDATELRTFAYVEQDANSVIVSEIGPQLSSEPGAGNDPHPTSHYCDKSHGFVSEQPNSTDACTHAEPEIGDGAGSETTVSPATCEPPPIAYGMTHQAQTETDGCTPTERDAGAVEADSQPPPLSSESGKAHATALASSS